MTTVTGTVIYWITYAGTTILVVAALLAGMFYLARGVYRAIRRLFS